VAFLAVATAGYSAFLFRQAEGRDFWQSPLLLPQLLVAAVVAGAASLLLAQAATGGPGTAALGGVLAAGLAAQVLVLVAELFGGHGGVDGVCAARLITRGRWSRPFWVLVVGAGTLLPIALLGLVPALAPVAAVLALVGLWVYEDVWLKAGQAVALS
jgi:formate-dependent nitrite reductase membrane component NrfD